MQVFPFCLSVTFLRKYHPICSSTILVAHHSTLDFSHALGGSFPPSHAWLRDSEGSWLVDLCSVSWKHHFSLVSETYGGNVRTIAKLTHNETGVLFYLSKWYTKSELNLRMSIFYSGSLISGAFGNLIAAGILSGLAGKRGISAW